MRQSITLENLLKCSHRMSLPINSQFFALNSLEVSSQKRFLMVVVIVFEVVVVVVVEVVLGVAIVDVSVVFDVEVMLLEVGVASIVAKVSPSVALSNVFVNVAFLKTG